MDDLLTLEEEEQPGSSPAAEGLLPQAHDRLSEISEESDLASTTDECAEEAQGHSSRIGEGLYLFPLCCSNHAGHTPPLY